MSHTIQTHIPYPNALHVTAVNESGERMSGGGITFRTIHFAGREITCGGIEWEKNQRCLRQEITAKCTAWLRAVCADSGEFLDFELRGGWKI